MYKIRNAGTGDIALIRELTWQVWPQTYAAILSASQIEYMLEMMYSERSLQEQMESGAQFIILYENDNPVGFASYQLMQPGLYKLHKLYVLPSQQGKGAGRRLIDHIIERISEGNPCALQLQVNRNNKAKLFYEKAGFKTIREVQFDIGEGYIMDDYIMELSLPGR